MITLVVENYNMESVFFLHSVVEYKIKQYDFIARL
jgi:hypothetical protein